MSRDREEHRSAVHRPRPPLRRRLLGAVAALTAIGLLAAACTGDDEGASPDDTTDEAGAVATSLDVSVTDAASLDVTEGGGPVLASATGDGDDAPFAWRTVDYTVEAKGGVYLGHELLSVPSDEEVPWTAAAAAEPATGDDGALSTVVRSADSGTVEEATLAVEPAGDRTVKVTLTAPDTATEISASFACTPDERFYGFGAQTWATQHRGETIPMWVVEQGLGKVTPETPEPVPSLLGEPYDSYLPTPWFWSSEGYGVSLDGFAYSTFELCTEEHPDAWRITSWDNELSWYVFTGDDPLDLIERYTGITGRPLREPPDWFYAPMNDAVRGEGNVERVAQLIRDNDIASSVIWTEDWIGLGSVATGFRLSHDWDVSPQDYPDLTALTDDLHADGFRFLVYFSPFAPDAQATPGGEATLPSGETIALFPQNDRKWPEATEGGYLFETPEGETYLMLTPPFVAPGGGGLDLTDPEAVDWFQTWLAAAEESGVDGSMTDFAEWVPFDAVFGDGRTGAEVHNEYPLLWQQAHREFWEQVRPDGDYLFYVRSGYTGTQRWAPAVWGGDQNTTFDRLDGLGSVVTMGVNVGMSGIAFWGHDIAGYSAFALPGIANTPTTKELFLRWAAIGAYTPMMRTHHGSRYGENWSFEGAPNPANPADPLDDPETLSIWKELAGEHISLFPYLQAYGVEAVEKGLPIMRLPILLYPDDPVFQGELPDDPALQAFTSSARPYGELFEYFLGNDLLVAPIVDEGVTERPVYLPSGDWVSQATGERFTGPTVVTATAAPGEIPVYLRAGAVVPKLPAGVETLAPSDDPEIVDVDDVADQLVIDVVLGADGRFTLTDGTTIELTSDGAIGGADEVTVTADGEELTPDPAECPAGSEDDSPCDPRFTEVTTPAGGDTDVTVTGPDGATATLRISGAPMERAYTIRFWG